MGCLMKLYLKNLLEDENIRSMVLWGTKFIWENLKHPARTPSTYVMYAP